MNIHEDVNGDAQSDRAIQYVNKPPSYFANAPRRPLALLSELRGADVLEIGCGSGELGRRALEEGYASTYTGVELSTNAAEIARQFLTSVHCGDIEKLNIDLSGDGFDLVICSEVLEHLVDPWKIVSDLFRRIKPGGLIAASSPNIAHFAIIRELLKGRFEYSMSGPMDLTHLRWFTPDGFKGMFADAGFDIITSEPLTPLRIKARIINSLTAGRLRHLLYTQNYIVCRKPN